MDRKEAERVTCIKQPSRLSPMPLVFLWLFWRRAIAQLSPVTATAMSWWYPQLWVVTMIAMMTITSLTRNRTQLNEQAKLIFEVIIVS